MTYEEAMDNIRCALDGGCHQVCNTKYRGDCTDAEIIASVETIQELVGKTDKFKWHDLRKNPDDLPQDIDDVLVYTQCGRYATAYFDGTGNSWRFYNADTNLDWEYVDESNCDDRIIAWREIETFEEVEE